MYYYNNIATLLGDSGVKGTGRSLFQTEKYNPDPSKPATQLVDYDRLKVWLLKVFPVNDALRALRKKYYDHKVTGDLHESYRAFCRECHS